MRRGATSMNGWQEWIAYGLAVISLLVVAAIVAIPI
jgi:hypothetical protein